MGCSTAEPEGNTAVDEGNAWFPLRKLLMTEDLGDALYIVTFRHVANTWPVLNNDLTVADLFLLCCPASLSTYS